MSNNKNPKPEKPITPFAEKSDDRRKNKNTNKKNKEYL